MATKYLGQTFDIHGGGVDLVFPHHENEIAQSKAAGDGFARYWLHNGLLSVGGEKMSKSIGNSLLIPEMLRRVRPVELRYYLGQPHYRSVIDYSEEALAEAAAAYQRIEGFAQRASEVCGPTPPASRVPKAFTDALDDDLGTPAAFAVVHSMVRDGNAALAEGAKERTATVLAEVRAMLEVLGLDPLSGQWASGEGAGLREVVDALVGVALEQRQAARARRDFPAADAIRGQLAEAGVTVEDTPQGARWELKRG